MFLCYIIFWGRVLPHFVSFNAFKRLIGLLESAVNQASGGF